MKLIRAFAFMWFTGALASAQITQTNWVVNLTWTAPSVCTAAAPCTFVVSRAPSGSSTWTQVGISASQAVSFQDTSVTAGSWQYVVQTQQAGASGPPSTVAPVTVPAGLPAPGGVNATPITVTVTVAVQ